MKIFERIEEDHKKQRDLMETLADTEGDSDKRNRAFDEFYEELKAHSAAEEQVFYAALMKDEDGTDKARHSVAEHKKALDLLKELKEMSMSSPGWLQKFKKLKHDNEHHMEEEENEVFPHAKNVLNNDTLEDMYKKFVERKQEELA